MYICKTCGQVFDRPGRTVDGFVDGDGAVCREPRSICPQCGDSDITPARSCGGCGGWRGADELLCAGCRQQLRRRFRAFVEDLCPEERETLDDWLDGASIQSAALGR